MEEGGDFQSGMDAVLEFTLAFHDKKPLCPPFRGFLLEGKQGFYLGVLCTCNFHLLAVVHHTYNLGG